MWHADGNMYAFEGKQNKKMKCHTPALSRILFLACNFNRRKKSRFLTFKTIKNRKSLTKIYLCIVLYILYPRIRFLHSTS